MYLAIEPQDATLVFQFFHDTYEKSTLFSTSNKSPEQWRDLVADPSIASAILSRLLRRVEVIHINGESYQMKHHQKMFSKQKCKVEMCRTCKILLDGDIR